MNKKLKKWTKRGFRGALCGLATYFALGLGFNYYFRPTFPEVEQRISVVKQASEEIKNHQPKRLLYLASSEFERNYDDYKNAVRDKLERWLMGILSSDLSSEEVAQLREASNEFNLDKEEFFSSFSALNLFQAENPITQKRTISYLVRAPVKDVKIDLGTFTDQESFFNALTNENVQNLDEIIIASHGLSYQITGKKDEFKDLLKQENNISIRDVLNLPEDQVQKIRSKLNPGAVIYLISCKTLENYENQTTIAEALAYLFQRPVIASVSNVLERLETIKLELDQNQTLQEEQPLEELSNVELIKIIMNSFRVKYGDNLLYGDWRVVEPRK